MHRRSQAAFAPSGTGLAAEAWRASPAQVVEARPEALRPHSAALIVSTKGGTAHPPRAGPAARPSGLAPISTQRATSGGWYPEGPHRPAA